MKKALLIRPNQLTRGFLCLFILLIFSVSGYSQSAGVSPPGSPPPNSDAGFDVNFTSMGMLIPRIALTSTDSFLPLSTHIAGMMVFNTANTADVIPGIYYNNGTKWISGVPKASTSGDMQYWNGTTWLTIPVGSPGQFLQINGSGIPTWTP